MQKEIQVVIKTKEQKERMHPIIGKALNDLIYRGYHRTVPLVYQYVHNPGERVIPNETNTIGFIGKIRFGNNGILGTAVIDDESLYGDLFEGEIDNIAVSILNEKNHKVIIDAFIFYNPEKKAEIRLKKSLGKTPKQKFIEKQYETPIMTSGTEQEQMKQVTEVLIKAFNEKYGIPQSDNTSSEEEKENDNDGDGNKEV